jgi:hypothetical protein
MKCIASILTGLCVKLQHSGVQSSSNTGLILISSLVQQLCLVWSESVLRGIISRL